MTEQRVSIPRVRIKGTEIYADAFTESLGGNAGGGIAYEAAGQGRRAKTWQTSSAGPKSVLAFNATTLRNRSRDAVRKNPFAESAIETLETSIIGTGITPQFRTPDEELNRQLAELFDDWSEESDADGRSGWVGLQAMAMRAVVEGGEVFNRYRIRRPGDMETVPLQLQLLEAEFCPNNHNRQLGPNEVINGIEFDQIGRRTAYWMHRRHPNDLSVQSRGANLQPVPVPATEIAHMFQPRRPGAIRGEPWLTRGLIKMHEIDAYDDAEVTRKKTATLIAGFVTRPAEQGYAGETANAAGEVQVRWDSGALLPLAPGEEITFSEPTDVGGTYEVFMRQQLRAIAVSAGVLYEQLTGDYSKVNDRTFRASINEFRRRMEMWQRNLIIFQMCRPTIKRWLNLAVLSGLVTVPASFGPRDLFKVKWMVPGWSYIHPVQEIQADIFAMRAGVKSRQQVVAERGNDVETIDEDIAADNARADELGNVYDSDPRKVSNAGLTQARPAGSVLPETDPDAAAEERAAEPEDEPDDDDDVDEVTDA